jgi:hypothetical protein
LFKTDGEKKFEYSAGNNAGMMVNTEIDIENKNTIRETIFLF